MVKTTITSYRGKEGKSELGYLVSKPILQNPESTTAVSLSTNTILFIKIILWNLDSREGAGTVK